MSEYKRFISYVYEYLGDSKENSRGFVKVECRNGICQIALSLKGLYHDDSGSGRIYGFRRKGDDLDGTFLANSPIQQGSLHMDIRFPEDNIGDKNYSIAEMAGLIVLDDNNTYYATQWDDAPMNFNGFPNAPENIISADETEPKEASSDLASEEIAPQETVLENTVPQEDIHATSAEPNTTSPHPYFRDGAITNCVKITPKNIRQLHESDWHLANNRFVHYGYQMFGHLLLGQLQETGETVLCVPGSYHQQECLMANMFGFLKFKQCPGQCKSSKCFGYWYRSIHPTNLCPGDCPL